MPVFFEFPPYPKIKNPQVGEYWELANLPSSKISHGYGSIMEKYPRWDDLNGVVVEITKVDGNLYSFIVVENPGYGSTISRNYFKHPVEKPKSYNCCQPSRGVCDRCRTEFIMEMEAQGKVYNKWTKTWQKRY